MTDKYESVESREQLLNQIVESNKSWSPDEVVDFYNTILRLYHVDQK